MSPLQWVPGARLPKAKLLRRVRLTILRTFNAELRKEWICASKHFTYLPGVDTRHFPFYSYLYMSCVGRVA